MDAGEGYETIMRALQSPARERYARLLELHRETLARYTEAVRRIDARAAARASSDGRTVAQVVAHIADWERYFILAAGELAAGVEWPQFMELKGYLEEDGRCLQFASVDDFNAYSARRTAGWPWERIQRMALRSAEVLYALYANAEILPIETLDASRMYDTEEFGFPLSIPVGWYLWAIAIGHELEEHAQDLQMWD